MFIYIKISNNLQFLALATVYGHLATVYYLLQKRAPTVNQIVQNGCLQFISFLGHYFTPVQNPQPKIGRTSISNGIWCPPQIHLLRKLLVKFIFIVKRKYDVMNSYIKSGQSV